MTRRALLADGTVRDFTAQEEAAADNQAVEGMRGKALGRLHSEAFRRIGQSVPEWGDETTIRFVLSIWDLLGGTKVSASQVTALAVYSWLNRRRNDVNGLDGSQARSFDPTAADPFGDADGWPTS